MTRIAIVLLLALAGTAFAGGDKDKADVLFKQGKKLLGEKRYADACAAFEESNKLDPGVGVQANVALCYEEWGKLARAYRAYAKAEQLAKQENDGPRLDKLRERMAALEPKVPKLTIKLPAGVSASSVKVTIDGAVVDGAELGKPQMVDPGPHLVEYTADGKKKHTVVPVEPGGSAELPLDITVEKKVEDKTPDDKPVEPAAQDPAKYWKYGAYGAWGAGGVMIVISSYMTLSARSKYNSALSQHCMGSTSMCDPMGLTATHDARHEANIATVLFLLGAAAGGGGFALWYFAPHAPKTEKVEALYVVPTASPDGGGVVLGGRF